MKFILRISLIAIIVAACFKTVAAEEKVEAKPLELPDIIVKGEEKLNVRSSVKRLPEKPKPLSQEELDSLNTLEKLQSPLLAAQPLPKIELEGLDKLGFVRGSFGAFSTADVFAGYGMMYEGYNLYGLAGFETSGGHIDNADYTKYRANIISDYIAPEKYWIFGGSKTRTTIDFKANDFKLYSKKRYNERFDYEFTGRVDVDGNYAGFIFETGAGFETMQIETHGRNSFDNSWNGYLSIKNLSEDYSLGGKMFVDMRNINGEGVNYVEGALFGKYSFGGVEFDLKAGLQSASSMITDYASGLLVAGGAEFRFDKDYTLRAQVRSGLDPTNLAEFRRANPYVNDTSQLDVVYDIADVGAFLNYHPNPNLGASFGAKIRIADDFPYFEASPSDSGLFDVRFDNAQIIQGLAEIFWTPNLNDRLSADLIFSYSNLSGENKGVPYIPAIKARAAYKRMWFEGFGTKIGLTYIGSRFVDIKEDEDRKLDGYISGKIGATYCFNKDLSAFLNFENLSPDDLFVWEAYKERTNFISFGVLWQF